MSYFACTAVVGVGNTISVQCADEFAGLDITCSSTSGRTYVRTCPTVSPYVVRFGGLLPGTYTLSVTTQGQTFSEEVAVQNTNATLDFGFNWHTWVDTSVDLDSTDYSTLSDLLADEEAVRELCLVHDCVDYLCSSASVNEDLETVIHNDIFAKWVNLSDYALDNMYANAAIADEMDTADKYGYGEWVITDDTTTPPTWGAKGNVPVMTSNTAPYGTAGGDADTNSYLAFDGDDSTSASKAGMPTSAIIWYKFPTPTEIKRADFFINFVTAPSSISAQVIYSDDASTWHDATEAIAVTNGVKKQIDVEPQGYHLYWGIRRIVSESKSGAGNTLQFYGRELSVSVPKMTSNTTPYGTVGSESSGTAYLAFSGNGASGNEWRGGVNLHLYYNFNKAVVANVMQFYNAADGSHSLTSNFEIVGSNDGSTFITLDTKTGVAYGSVKAFHFENTTPYRYYGIKALNKNNNYGSGDFRCALLQFYGKDYSEKEFEEGATKKWLYDHGVELETLEDSSLLGSLVKGSDSMTLTSPSSGIARISTSSAIDTSDYSLERTKFGSPFSLYNDSYGCTISLSAAKDTFSNKGFADTLKGLLPNNTGLDISSVNESVYPWVYISNFAGTWEIKEWWLE